MSLYRTDACGNVRFDGPIFQNPPEERECPECGGEVLADKHGYYFCLKCEWEEREGN